MTGKRLSGFRLGRHPGPRSGTEWRWHSYNVTIL